LDRLDKGWFYCYKIVVYIYLGFTILETLSNFALAIYALFSSGGDPRTSFAFAMSDLYLIWFLHCQLEAINNMDFTAAREAMNGFILFIVIKTALLLIAFYFLYDYLDVTSAILYGAPFIVFVCVFFGSVQVYLLLKKNQSGGYQNMNHVAP